MQIGRTTLDRIEQHLVNKPHHWRIIGFVMRRIVLFGIAGHFDIRRPARNRSIPRVTRQPIRRTFDGFTELVILNQHGLDGKPRIELDVTDRLMIG